MSDYEWIAHQKWENHLPGKKKYSSSGFTGTMSVSMVSVHLGGSGHIKLIRILNAVNHRINLPTIKKINW